MSDHRAPISDPGKVDADLIKRCLECAADGWDASFHKCSPMLARFGFQLSADFCHEDTEEICQETFLAVVRNLGSFRGKSSFQTWLLRIAANKAMDFRGKSRAEKRGGSFVHFSLDGADEGEQIDLPSRGPGPDALLASAETGRLVRQSLDQLEDDCREIIELRYYGDLSYAEIAAELQLNPKTVSSRLSKCLDRLSVIAKKIFPPEHSFAV